MFKMSKKRLNFVKKVWKEIPVETQVICTCVLSIIIWLIETGGLYYCNILKFPDGILGFLGAMFWVLIIDAFLIWFMYVAYLVVKGILVVVDWLIGAIKDIKHAIIVVKQKEETKK